jgi:DNA-directed RNA polymerase specialized sigma24 family protein
MRRILTEQEKADIINLSLQHKTILEISDTLKISTSAVQRHISDFRKSFLEVGEGYFDIDELDCWLAPTSHRKN